jgi:hypothetical protein
VAAARTSVLFALLSLATLPAAIAATHVSRDYELLDAGYAIPLALLLGALAVGLARRARRGQERMLGPARAAGTATVGRVLGLTGFLLAVTAAMAIGFYVVLSHFAE